MSEQNWENSPNNQLSPKQHIIPLEIYLGVFALLLLLTFASIFASRIGLGSLTLPLLILLAVIQAALIVGFFMRLRYDYRFLSVVFFGTGILVFSFFALTMTDLTNRGHTIQDERIQVSALVADVRSADILAPVHTADAITVLIARHKAAKKAAELKDKPQVAPDVKKPEYRPPPPDVLALGQQKFAQNCTLCHGAKGMGDGPGAKGMRVTPSAFGKGEFRYGKTFDDIMQIIKNGVVQNGMTSYGWMPENEREALTYYILHLDHLGQ